VMAANFTYACPCGAIVGIGTRWMYGSWISTTTSFVCSSILPGGRCPMCQERMKFGLWFWDC
jgi:hypothetical protein